MMSEDDMPDEHERINEVRNQRSSGGAGVFPSTAPTIHGTTEHSLQKKVQNVKKILICDDCSEWYDYSEDWATCPKCGEELSEVEKA